MKRKILSIFFALVLVLSFSLVTAVPAGANGATLNVMPIPIALQQSGGFIEWSTAKSHTGSNSVHLKTTSETPGREARIQIMASSIGVHTLADLDSISWWEYLEAGYPPHVDIGVDTDGNGSLNDYLVIEYAYNTSEGHVRPEGQPNYGALTGNWYRTFSDDGYGPVVIDDGAYAWLTSQASGPVGGEFGAGGHYGATLADWKAGLTGPTGEISASTAVINFAIEVDNWRTPLVQADAYVDDIAFKINGVVYFGSIQHAIDAASPGDTIIVAAGTYAENVTIDKTLTLLSTSGSESTTIQGDTALGGELGTVFVTNNTNGVQIGDIGHGFTIIGIDGPPGLEKAAVYFQGNHSNAVIKGNDIVADGDAGLITEWGATITSFVISNNEFSGQTFPGAIPGGEGFTDQFFVYNVPRQLANMGGGSGGGNTSNITFTDNHITGTAGGISIENNPQGNTLITIDSAGSTITGNVFEGTTTRWGASLRARGPNATITGNDFKSTGLTPSNGHLYLEENPIDSALIAANTFDKGVYVENAGGGTIGLSIQGFVSAVPEGTTINVLAGTYTETLVVDKQLTLQGAGSASTIIDASGASADYGILLTAGGTSASQRLTIKGLTIKNSPSHGIKAYKGGGLNLDYVTFEDLVLTLNGVRGMEIHNDVTVSDMEIKGCEFVENVAQGLRTASNVIVDGMTITDSKFNGNSYGIYLQGTINGVTILRSEFNNSIGGYGGYMTETGPLTNLVIEDSEFNNNVVGLMIWNTQDNADITITRTLFQENDKWGVMIWGTTLTDVLIEDSTVLNNDVLGEGYYGIDFNTYAEAMTNVAVHFTSITGHTVGGGVKNRNTVATAIVDALYNWWGDASGPSGIGSGTGDAVTDNVNFAPWLGAEAKVEKTKTGDNIVVDAKTEADTEVIKSGTGTPTITAAKYSSNPGTGFSGDIGKYIDVHVDDPASDDEIEIRLYYTNPEIAGRVESSLRLLWWNETSWVACSHSGVNTTDIAGTPAYSGYMWAKIRSTGTIPTLTQLSGTAFSGHGGTLPSPPLPPTVTLESIAALPSSLPLGVDETQQLTVTATYSDESTDDVTAEASYESSVTSVTTVSNAGLITGVAEGSATITVSYTEDEIEATDTVLVTVIAFTPWSYDADGDGVIDKSEALVAVVDYFDGFITKAEALEVIALYFAS